MRQSLQIKLSQQITLTPQLQQSIKLLQLSTLELQQEIEQVVRDNPLLERTDNPMSSNVRLVGDALIKEQQNTESFNIHTNTSTRDANQINQENNNDIDLNNHHSESENFSDPTGNQWDTYWNITPNNPDDEDSAPPQIATQNISLNQHLNEQLRLTNCSIRDRALVELLIDSTNEDGYLETNLEEILESLPSDLGIEPEELNTALRLLQSFDPIGVGARNAAECLRLQIIYKNSRTAHHLDQKIALTIIDKHLDWLAKKEYSKIKKTLEITDEELRQAEILIKSLHPFPGAHFNGVIQNFITPDVIVKKDKQKWVVFLNDAVMPKLQINERYAKILKEQRKQYGHQLATQLQEARWLIKNIQQRFETILRVSRKIVETQQAFFNHGEVAMQPLVLREIAEQLNLHESTVSRVTNQKFMLTPFGTFELKHFFGSHITTENGITTSSTAIKALLKQLIQAEDPKQPLSDNQISDIFNQQGITVARRTIAKYRESLQIPPMNLRKSL